MIIPMLEYDKKTSTNGNKILVVDNNLYNSILHYMDADVNEAMFDFLESALLRYYEDSKYIKIEIDAINNKNTIGIWLKMSFDEKDDYNSLIPDFQSEFEQVYQEIEKEYFDSIRYAE